MCYLDTLAQTYQTAEKFTNCDILEGLRLNTVIGMEKTLSCHLMEVSRPSRCILGERGSGGHKKTGCVAEPFWALLRSEESVDPVVWTVVYATAVERMARDRKITRGKIWSVRRIHCCPNSFSFLYTVKNMCIFTHIWLCRNCIWITVATKWQSETFLHKSGAVRNVDWIFIIGAPVWRWLGEYVTLDRTF